MTAAQMETAINFLMGKLSEEDLAELDAMMTGSTPANGMAGDAALNSPQAKRKAFLALDSAGRNAVRSGAAARTKAILDSETSLSERFPDNNRLLGISGQAE